MPFLHAKIHPPYSPLTCALYLRRPLYTLPKEPSPIISSTWYLSMMSVRTEGGPAAWKYKDKIVAPPHAILVKFINTSTTLPIMPFLTYTWHILHICPYPGLDSNLTHLLLDWPVSGFQFIPTHALKVIQTLDSSADRSYSTTSLIPSLWARVP